LITPAICCNCFSKVDEDAMNFIRRNLSEAKLLKITLLATLFGPPEAASYPTSFVSSPCNIDKPIAKLC